ncbi:MAG: MoaD/ThiS family protein [Thermoleophilia bacterium]
MRIELRLFSTLGDLAGRRRLSLDLPEGASVATLVRTLRASPEWNEPAESAEYSWRHGSTGFSLSVNRVHVRSEAWEARLLNEGDDVWLQPPLAGG